MKLIIGAVIFGLLSATSGQTFAATAVPAASVPDVSPNVALSSLIEASDSHLQKMADTLATFALNPEIQSGDWEKIREPLQEVAKLNVEAVNWFALPNGDYWTVQEGRAGNLSDRPYFADLLAGKTVLGSLVVSRSTGKSVAIVAVPVYGTDGELVGALGASVYLDKLSELLRSELGFTNEMIYYSFDSTPLIGINWNPAFILADPKQLGGPDVAQAIDEMLKKNEGAESYSYQGTTRTVIFRKSNVTGWWYAFGTLSSKD